MKQKIEIEVPEGKVAIWDEKRQKITFEDIKPWKDIKTFDDVLKYLEISKKEFEIAQNSRIPINKWQLIMEAFLEMSNDNSRLSVGTIYYPYFYIVYNDKYKFDTTDIKVRSCIINNKKCTLVGGHVFCGSTAGLGLPYSYHAVACSAYLGFHGFSSRQVAEHVSKYFTWELFESTIGWRTDEIELCYDR